jgi:hypothetical protein
MFSIKSFFNPSCSDEFVPVSFEGIWLGYLNLNLILCSWGKFMGFACLEEDNHLLDRQYDSLES